jgi:hypothetical protein
LKDGIARECFVVGVINHLQESFPNYYKEVNQFKFNCDLLRELYQQNYSIPAATMKLNEEMHPSNYHFYHGTVSYNPSVLNQIRAYVKMNPVLAEKTHNYVWSLV